MTCLFSQYGVEILGNCSSAEKLEIMNLTESNVSSAVLTTQRNEPERIFNGPAFHPSIWILSEVVTSLLCIGTVWSFAAVVSYATSTDKWNRSDKPKAKISNLWVLASLCPATFLLRVLTTQSLIIIDRTFPNNASGDYACEVVVDTSVVLFSFSTFPAYLFFWYRQKMLYSQPSLKHLKTKTVRFFNVAFLTLFLLGGGSSCFIHTIPTSYQMSNLGCVMRPGRQSALANQITAATLIVSQLILLGLFCHPLCLHRSSGGAARARSASSASRGKKRNKEERVYTAIRKATVSMLLCVSSDVAALVSFVTIASVAGTPLCLLRLVYDVSLFVNIVAVVYSFEGFSKILFAVFRTPGRVFSTKRIGGMSASSNVNSYV